MGLIVLHNFPSKVNPSTPVYILIAGLSVSEVVISIKFCLSVAVSEMPCNVCPISAIVSPS